jgi:hypothetical protein
MLLDELLLGPEVLVCSEQPIYLDEHRECWGVSLAVVADDRTKGHDELF